MGANCSQLGITAFIPFQPAANYLSLTLRNLGYSVFEANMLAIPGYFLFFVNVRCPQMVYRSYIDSCVQILVIVWLSERYNERLLFSSVSNIWVLPFLIALIAIPPMASSWVRYALLTGVNGEPYSKVSTALFILPEF